MKLRRVLAVTLAAVMVFTSLQLTAFAASEDENQNKYPNFTGSVFLENWECQEVESFEALKDLPLTITITDDADPDKTASIEMEYDEDTGEYSAAEFNDSPYMKDILADITANQQAALKDGSIETDEAYYDALFEGYTVSLNLGDNSHFTADISNGGVLMSEYILWSFEFEVAMLVEEMGWSEDLEFTSYMQMMDYSTEWETDGQYTSYEEYLWEEGYAEWKIDELLSEILILDDALAEARADAFAGQLYMLINLLCDCPKTCFYEIAHVYMIEKDGDLEIVDVLWEDGKEGDELYIIAGKDGDTVRAEDWLTPKYNGEIADYVGATFQYSGSYNSYVLWDDELEDWSTYEAEEYVLGQDSFYGLALTYVLPEQALAKPTIKVANNESTGKPVISWNKVSGATKYELWMSTGGSYKMIGTTTGTSITHNSATAGSLYYYKIKAVNKRINGVSDFSDRKYIRCRYAKPTIKVTNNEKTGKPVISWNKVSGAAKYELWMSTGGSYKMIGTTTGTSITHNSATTGSLYYYKVKAVGGNANAASEFSDRKYTRCKYAKPVIKVKTNSSGKPVISWNKVSGATKYELWMSTGGSYSKIGTTTGTSITHNSAKKGKLYYYKVKAVGSNANAASAFSDRLYIRCK